MRKALVPSRLSSGTRSRNAMSSSMVMTIRGHGTSL
jgi:hypothetical protein